MLRKKRRISESIDDDPMSGISNLSDAMLVLALGFLIFAIMALSANPDLISDSPNTKDVSTADTFNETYSDAGGIEDSGYNEVGKVYEARVVKVEDFGCFVQLWPGCEGMVHVSQLAHERVEKASDMVKEGDEIIVMSLGYDQKGSY